MGEEKKHHPRQQHRDEASESSEQQSSSGSRDLKEREYRDKEGKVHHHTHTSEEMKKKAS